MTASIPLARKSSTLRSRAAAFCGSAGTTRIFASGPSSPNARAAWRKTAGSTKRKISGAWARTAEPKVSVCQPFTTTTARAMAARSGELKMNGGGSAPAAARGLKTSKPTSSSSGRLRARQLDSGGQTRGREQFPDPFQLTRREAGEFGGKVGGDHLADGNRFAMKIFSVAGDSLDGMANGVTEVQNFTHPGLGFVLA